MGDDVVCDCYDSHLGASTMTTALHGLFVLDITAAILVMCLMRDKDRAATWATLFIVVAILIAILLRDL
jgi:uncharacterized membrane protein YhaH (DUF805 family)